MVKRDIPESLKKLQELKRKETLDEIQMAIENIQFEGGIVSKKRLMEITGFSNSTFSKQHVKELLKKNKVCQYKETTTIKSDKGSITIDALTLEIQKLKKENIKLKDTVISKDIKINELEVKITELDDKYRRVLGKLHQVMRLAEAKGVYLDK